MNTEEILIVDDTPDHIAFAGSILKSEGYKVYAASSGEAALNFLNKKLPDLIVLDIKMAGMNGLEVCRIIKENPDTMNIPVIFLTSENSSEVIRKGFEIGCCDYVTKPFLKEEYLARVKTHLNISRQNRELSAAYNELNVFCSAVSHDLKSPLNVIKMLIDTLRDELGEDADDEVHKITDMINEKSTQLIVMIERLLEFSRMCNINPDFEMLNLNQIFNDIFNELKSLESERNITLIEGNLPEVTGDAVLIKMAVKNIMTNAFKFTKYRKNALITISSFEEEGYTVISIKDNGAGFDMAYSEKLFAIFQRLHDNREFEGSGVGLAMVERIMRRHNGKVRIIGEKDKGAEIFLYFSK